MLWTNPPSGQLIQTLERIAIALELLAGRSAGKAGPISSKPPIALEEAIFYYNDEEAAMEEAKEDAKQASLREAH